MTLIRREVLLPPGAERPGDDPAWHGALVVVVRGPVELGRARAPFQTGAVLYAEGLTVRNGGPQSAVLVAYARG